MCDHASMTRASLIYVYLLKYYTLFFDPKSSKIVPARSLIAGGFRRIECRVSKYIYKVTHSHTLQDRQRIVTRNDIVTNPFTREGHT